MNDIREALTKAFETSESEDQEESKSTPTPQELMEAPAEAVTEAPAEVKEPETAEAKEAPPAEEGTEEAPKETGFDKAPASWSLKARQAWATLPAEARNEIVKRERDFAIGIQKNSEAAKYGFEVQRALAPFQSVIRLEGADDITAISSLAQTAATLRLGTQMQKASILRDLISAYEVDIGVLDSVLAGEQVSDEDHKISKLLEQKLAPFQQLLSSIEEGKRAHASTVISKVDQEIANFEKSAEFINDVRDEMADILEIAARRGKPLTLQQAYNRAIALREDIIEIVQKRKHNDTLKEQHRKVQEKRQAAASLPSGTGGNPVPKQASSIREALENAFSMADSNG